MQRTQIKDILIFENPKDEITVAGWVRTKRDSKEFSFLEINDGSCLKNLQIIIAKDSKGYEQLAKISTGASVNIVGNIVASLGKGQKWEMQSQNIQIFGEADESYPLQKKRHNDEFLRTIAHLRPRTNKFGALTRIRSELAFAIHSYFHKRGFFNIHTPIITGADCEGAGEMFQVSTLNLEQIPKLKTGKVDFTQDFFGKEASLTVSGQLTAENVACALGNVYTFGPTFRAENSNTPKHVAEFWMLEPEMAFANLQDDMDLGEDCVKYFMKHLLDNSQEDLELFNSFVDPTLLQTLDTIINKPFDRIPYTEAIKILQTSKREFEFPVEFGCDLQTEHERYLAEIHCQKPVIVFDYPKEIKAFYMRQNDDGRTVAAMDLLVPRIGELIGGSQREERLDLLKNRIIEMKLPLENYWWYLDLRKFGSVPHAGFGLGFERLIMLATGISNIRDVISFPRSPKNVEF